MTALALALLAAGGPLWLGPKPPAEVSRVVTTAPSLTQTVVALGATERLVGVSRFDEDPQLASLPRVGGFNDVSVETVLALRPHLVVVQKGPGNQKAVTTLGRLGVPVLALPLTTVNDVSEAMRLLGDVLHREAAARSLVETLAQARATVRAAGQKRATKPRVLLAYGFSPLVVAGPGSFADELLADCGAVNLAKRSPTAYPTYPVERAVKLAPDVFIDAAGAADGHTVREALAPLGATRWVKLPSDDLMQPGPALARGLPQLCRLLDPPPAGATD